MEEVTSFLWPFSTSYRKGASETSPSDFFFHKQFSSSWENMWVGRTVENSFRKTSQIWMLNTLLILFCFSVMEIVIWYMFVRCHGFDRLIKLPFPCTLAHTHTCMCTHACTHTHTHRVWHELKKKEKKKKKTKASKQRGDTVSIFYPPLPLRKPHTQPPPPKKKKKSNKQKRERNEKSQSSSWFVLAFQWHRFRTHKKKTKKKTP